MALNFPSSPSAEQIYIDDSNITWKYDGIKWGVIKSTGYKTYSGISAKLSTDFYPTSTSTALPWDSISINIGDYIEYTEPTKIIFRESAFYRINISLLTGSEGSSYTINIKKNNNIILSTITTSINQFINYDEILVLTANDYIEVYVEDTSSAGTINSIASKLEVTKIGLTVGSSAEVFSGVKALLSSNQATTSSSAPIIWSETVFNQNSNSAGALYWSASDPTKILIGTNSFYRIKIVLMAGSSDSYTLVLRKNNSTNLTSVILGSGEVAQLDEIFQLNANDYLQILVNDLENTGNILSSSYIELIRIGNTL